MREIHQRMAALGREGRPFAVATVVRTSGSTPQVVGAKMLVDDLGRITGTLGGGCVEGDAFEQARAVIAGGGARVAEHRLNEDLAWNTGLVCGGTMWIAIEPGDEALRAGGEDLLGDVLAASGGGAPVALVTLLRRAGSDPIRGRMLLEADGRTRGTLGDAGRDGRAIIAARETLERGTARSVALDDDEDLLIEPVLSRSRLVVVGGGHVGRALALQAGLLDLDVTVVDDRPEFADRDRFPAPVEVVRADMAAALADLGIEWNTFIVVATRGHKLDADCLRAAIRTRARYVGLLGSRRKTILIARMLRDEGVSEERLASVHAPVGLDLGGRTPAEIALSVLAEITALRHGGDGRPLRLPSDAHDQVRSPRP